MRHECRGSYLVTRLADSSIPVGVSSYSYCYSYGDPYAYSYELPPSEFLELPAIPMVIPTAIPVRISMGWSPPSEFLWLLLWGGLPFGVTICSYDGYSSAFSYGVG